MVLIWASSVAALATVTFILRAALRAVGLGG
jgi:Protein of unknown function (DUF2474)